jgi:clan AA aspartic protease (TIGR02281 family)
MRKVLLVAVAAALALTASSGLARKSQVPIEGNGKVLVVEATINQRLTGHFLLDTGASYCFFSKATAKDASIKADGAKIKVATGNGTIEATMGEARRIELGDAIARDVEVAVLEKDPMPGLLGVIGLSFLQNFKYSIDSERGVLLLEN